MVFGHTHRPGPLPDDAVIEWLGAGDLRLVNTGSWCYSAMFLTSRPGESPYWPGSAVLVDEQGAPQVLRLLQDVGHDQAGRRRALSGRIKRSAARGPARNRSL